MSAPLSGEQLAEIRAREAAATPGRWLWFAVASQREIRLQTEGWDIVLDFARWGMQSAQPRFNTKGLMVDGAELLCDGTDVPAKGHPDAEFIAHARQDVPALLAEIERLREHEQKVAEFVAKRAEYITAIENCHPDNAHDYNRWQGHAESRRQLAQALGLPVAWPEAAESHG